MCTWQLQLLQMQGKPSSLSWTPSWQASTWVRKSLALVNCRGAPSLPGQKGQIQKQARMLLYSLSKLSPCSSSSAICCPCSLWMTASAIHSPASISSLTKPKAHATTYY